MTDELSRRDPRQYLSKSFLVGADLCGRRAWLDLNDPRPFRMNEAVAFGKAVDIGVQMLVGMTNAGLTLQDGWGRIEEEVLRMIGENPTDPVVEEEEVFHALASFWDEVVGTDLLDLRSAKVQHHVRLPIEEIGMIDAHPDLVLRDGTIIDIKTSAKAKAPDAAALAYAELGFYAMVAEEETGIRPPRVGYLTWVRSSRPTWQLVTAPVTESMVTIARELSATTARAIYQDGELNAGAKVRRNYTFPGGPKFTGLCRSCSHNPANGGRCTITEGGA